MAAHACLCLRVCVWSRAHRRVYTVRLQVYSVDVQRSIAVRPLLVAEGIARFETASAWLLPSLCAYICRMRSLQQSKENTTHVAKAILTPSPHLP